MDILHIAQKYDIRLSMVNNQPMLCLTDIGKVLGWKRPKDSISSLSASQKQLVSIKTPGGNQSLLHVTEDGFKRLLCRSRKSKASLIGNELGIDMNEYRVRSAEESTLDTLCEIFAGEKITPQRQVCALSILTFFLIGLKRAR
jgi:hypothetical protein